ncbi:hypothetical protein OIDMADRAFT_48952 [Oidiodendron maius Zn]|uniref:Major facilitator superfamily (MFS) profile domain-containing protein n=1 Tax=Oidiodendron maius (strain Zn) TaxID=913774 RepID=A0A0C3E458_OIDMZ|nr:hypothetical protein OIDMADRAFT_48952 [Oidiodendron maius Zn]
MATIETTKKTVEHVEEHEGVQELTNSVTVAHQEDADDHKISKLDAIKKDKTAVLWCLFVVWTSLLVSFESNASGNVIGIPQFRQNFGSLYNGEYVLAAKWQSAFTAAPTASFAVGALTCGLISDTIGRKYTVMAGLVGSYISVTMEVVANTNGLFFAGKFLNGFVVGMLAAVCPTYLGEIVPLALRGLLTAMIAFAYALAPLTAAVIVNSTGTKTNVWAYRSVFCAQYGFCFVSTVFAPFIPESPWWLASKGRDEKALASLRRLGCNTDIEAVRKLALIKVTLEEVRRETEGVTYFECFRVSNLRRTMISVAPLTIQALGGVIFIAGYFVYYAELAGYSSAAAFKLYVIFQVISMCGNITSWFVIDRVGRRDLTLYGTASLMVILMLAGGLATAGKTPYIKGCFSMMMIYAFVYNCTIGATGYTLLTEIATSRLRVKTIAIGIALQNIIYMVLGFVLPYLFNPNYLNLGAKISFIFGGFSVVSVIYLYFYQPETAGRSYEELDAMFTAKVPARKFKAYITEVNMRVSAETKGDEAI